jgi:hypothetical protein
MIELQSTLNGETKKVEPNKMYVVDFSKMQSVNDLMVVLSALGITFPSDHPLIEHLTPFLNLDNPIDLPKQPNRAPFVPLDKLDTKQ